VLKRTDAKDGSTIIQVRIPEDTLSRFHRSFPDARTSN
jgi:hypothetical protein